jgi:hypothetical protein
MLGLAGIVDCHVQPLDFVLPFACIEGQRDKAVSGLERIGELDFPFAAEVALDYDAREFDHNGETEGGYLCVGTTEKVHVVSHLYFGGEHNSYLAYVYCIHTSGRAGWVPSNVLALPLFQHLPLCCCLRCVDYVRPLQNPPASSMARSSCEQPDIVTRSRRLRERRLEQVRTGQL